MADCRDCKHNVYLASGNRDWIDCSHPTTLKRGPHWEKGDPAFVNYRTADVPVSRIAEIGECPTWEPVSLQQSGGQS